MNPYAQMISLMLNRINVDDDSYLNKPPYFPCCHIMKVCLCSMNEYSCVFVSVYLYHVPITKKMYYLNYYECIWIEFLEHCSKHVQDQAVRYLCRDIIHGCCYNQLSTNLSFTKLQYILFCIEVLPLIIAQLFYLID